MRRHLRLFLCRLGSGDKPAVAEHGQHTLEDIHKALAARVHYAGLFQHRQLFGCVGQRVLRGLAHQRPQGNGILPGTFSRLFAGHTRHREHGALGGLHHRFVGALHSLLQGGRQIRRLSGALACQRLGKAAEQKAGDNAGIPPCPAQHSAGRDLGGGLHRAVVRQSLQLGHGRADGHAHICAGVSVRHREHVQLIYACAAVGKIVGTGKDAVS